MRRYPLSALVEASGLSETALARQVGLSGSTLKQARSRGLVEAAADRYAVRIGFHPTMVWSDWGQIPCGNERCEQSFVPTRRRHFYCSTSCQRRVADRRSKAKVRQDPDRREAERRKLNAYRADPRVREIGNRMRRLRYYANRERELERQRIYDRTVRAERRRQQQARGHAA